MKLKSTVTTILLSLFLAGSAYAVPWTMDFSSLSTSGIEAKYTGVSWSTTLEINEKIGIENGGLLPYTTIIQDLGADGILNNGDTFEEAGFIGQVSVDGKAVSFRDADDPDFEYIAYFNFSGLTGYLTNYDDGGDGIATDLTSAGLNALENDSFDLVFNPGVGTIEFWLDDNLDPLDGGFAKLADFELLVGEGTSPELIVDQAEGQFGIKQGFTSVMPGVWSFEGGTFEDWLATYGLSSIWMESLNLGATLKGVTPNFGENSFTFAVENIGAMSIGAVPEPTTMVLFGIGLLGLAGVSRRKLS